MLRVVTILLVVLVIVCLFGILADATIAYGIFRFKKLKTIPNIILANWALAHMLAAAILPVNILIYALSPIYGNHVGNCLSIHAEITSHLVVLLFCILLCVDWCAEAYWPTLSKKLRKYYTYLILFIWFTFVPLCITSTGLCVGYITDLRPTILLAISYFINLLFVIIFHCSKLAQKFRVKPVNFSRLLRVRLIIITAIPCSYLAAIISTAFAVTDAFGMRDNYLLTCVCILLSVIAIQATSVLVLGILCILDTDFRLCLFPMRTDNHMPCEGLDSENLHCNKDIPSTAAISTSV